MAGSLPGLPFFATSFVGKKTRIHQWRLWFGDGYYCCRVLEAMSQDFLCFVYSAPHSKIRSKFATRYWLHRECIQTIRLHSTRSEPQLVKLSFKKKKDMLCLKPTHAFFSLVLTEMVSPVTFTSNLEQPKPASNTSPLLCFTEQRMQHTDSNDKTTIYNILYIHKEQEGCQEDKTLTGK